MSAKDLSLPRYRPSGAVRLSIVPATIASLFVAAVIGVIYGIVAQVNPFVLVDVFLVFGLGFGVGVIGRLTCHYAHCRNRLVSLGVASALGLVALAASYWIDFRLDRAALANGGTMTFTHWVAAKIETGWIIKGGQINGPFVFIVWGSEAFFVLTLAAMLGWQAGEEPYCEQCRAWPKNYRLALKGRQANEFWNAAKSGTPLAILQLPKVERTDVSLVLDGLICENCHNGFLNVDEETMKTENGKAKTTRTPLVQGIVLDQRNCESFLAVPPEAV